MAQTSDGGQGGAKSLLHSLARNVDNLPPEAADVITQLLLLVLGSGPSIATLEALLRENHQNGLNQHDPHARQLGNILNMALTAKCVRQMLDNPEHDLPDPFGD